MAPTNMAKRAGGRHRTYSSVLVWTALAISFTRLRFLRSEKLGLLGSRPAPARSGSRFGRQLAVVETVFPVEAKLRHNDAQFHLKPLRDHAAMAPDAGGFPAQQHGVVAERICQFLRVKAGKLPGELSVIVFT